MARPHPSSPAPRLGGLSHRERRDAQRPPVRDATLEARTRTTLVLAAAFTVYWIIVLRLDTFTDTVSQVGLGILTWLFLGIALWLSPPKERVQVVTMVAVATGFECFSSLLVGFYRYRLDNLPMYVPPGHGLFFLLALRVSSLPAIESRGHLVVTATVAFSIALALRGCLLMERPDLFGLGAWLVLLVFLRWGNQSVFYSVSFLMTMTLEFYGTSLGLWTWTPVAPLVGLAAANPPAGIGAGYCVMDAIARRLSPHTQQILGRVRVGARLRFNGPASPSSA